MGMIMLCFAFSSTMAKKENQQRAVKEFYAPIADSQTPGIGNINLTGESSSAEADQSHAGSVVGDRPHHVEQKGCTTGIILKVIAFTILGCYDGTLIGLTCYHISILS
jgi:hypothetical protein